MQKCQGVHHIWATFMLPAPSRVISICGTHAHTKQIQKPILTHNAQQCQNYPKKLSKNYDLFISAECKNKHQTSKRGQARLRRLGTSYLAWLHQPGPEVSTITTLGRSSSRRTRTRTPSASRCAKVSNSSKGGASLPRTQPDTRGWTRWRGCYFRRPNTSDMDRSHGQPTKDRSQPEGLQYLFQISS